MCCAIVALTMTLLAAWRSISPTPAGRGARLRRIAIVVIAIGAAAGAAMAADRFAVAGRGQLSLLTYSTGMPVCGGRLIR